MDTAYFWLSCWIASVTLVNMVCHSICMSESLKQSTYKPEYGKVLIIQRMRSDPDKYKSTLLLLPSPIMIVYKGRTAIIISDLPIKNLKITEFATSETQMILTCFQGVYQSTKSNKIMPYRHDRCFRVECQKVNIVQQLMLNNYTSPCSKCIQLFHRQAPNASSIEKVH